MRLDKYLAETAQCTRSAVSYTHLDVYKRQDEAEDMGVAALGVVDLQAHALQLAAELMHLYVGGILF